MRFTVLLALAAVSAFAEKKVITPEGVPRSSSPLSAAIEADGMLWVSGMVGRDAAGRFARGDVKAQTQQTLANIRAALKAAGLDFSHVVSTNLYLADVRTLPEADEAYRVAFPKDFPARTVLESMLMAPEALVEISAIAIRDLARRRFIRPDGWSEPQGPFSHAVDAAGTLFLSSLHPVHPGTGHLAGTSIQAQTERVMRNQEELLKAAGFLFADLVTTRIFLADSASYSGLNDVYRRFVTAPPPARATLNAFPVHLGHLLQTQSVAVKGSGEGRPTGESWTSPIHSYSVKAGRRLYITGMTGRAPDGQFALNDIRAQTRQALATIEVELKKHGFTWADIVDSTVYLRDTRHFAAMNEVYRETVKLDPPARATVRIPLNSVEGLVEIMMVAVR